MARAGRKAKHHRRKRTKSGQLSRKGKPRLVYDRGNEIAQRMRELYGENCTTALGRAFEAGLLGPKDTAKPLLDTGQALHVAYWKVYAVGPYKCTLGGNGAASSHVDDLEADKRSERWLNEMLDAAQATGFRKEFDELVIAMMSDSGPLWLDRLLHDAETQQKTANDMDKEKLRRAVSVLEGLV